MSRLFPEDAFNKASEIERKGILELISFIEQYSLDGHFVITSGGRLSKIIQRRIGDFIIQSKQNRNQVFGLEIKVEEENKYGNFFLETWSNRKEFTPGWIYESFTDLLIYYFYKEKQAFLINFYKLKHWAFIYHSERKDNKGNSLTGRIYDFPEKAQSKYIQFNDTYGRCVPIEIIRKEVGFEEYKKNGEKWKLVN